MRVKRWLQHDNSASLCSLKLPPQCMRKRSMTFSLVAHVDLTRKVLKRVRLQCLLRLQSVLGVHAAVNCKTFYRNFFKEITIWIPVPNDDTARGEYLFSSAVTRERNFKRACADAEPWKPIIIVLFAQPYFRTRLADQNAIPTTRGVKGSTAGKIQGSMTEMYHGTMVST